MNKTYTYTVYHLPEQCTCEHHQKVFIKADQTFEALSDRLALEHLAKWNDGSSGACWVYAFKGVHS